MRRESWRSVPSTYRPPRSTTSSCSLATSAWAFSSALGPGGLVLLGRLVGRKTPLAQGQVGGELRVAAEHDVGAAAGHVGGDGDRALAPGGGDDRGLARVLLGVEHLVRDAAAQQQRRQPLGLGDAGRADQDRLAGLVPLGDVVDDGGELRVLGLVDEVGLVDAQHRLGWSGSARRRACRSGAARRPRSGPCRSCPRASCRAGSSSAG